MAKHTLVAVGGSGQSAAIAYLRLATISGMPAEDLPNIYVIDADVKDRQGADAKPSLYSSLKVLFNQLVQGVALTNRPKLELIYPYTHHQAHEVMSNSTVFADYIIHKGGTKQEMALVTDALFSKKLNHVHTSVLSEQDVPLSKGFMARPNVGATTFFDKLHQGKDKLEGPLSRLQDSVVNSQNQAVTVVIGSSFGGTGSGVAPSLAQQLTEWAMEAGQKTKIGLFMTLPWFNPNAGKTQADALPTHGNTEVQRRNTAGGLRYYASSATFRHFDVFVADYAGQIQLRNDDSNSEQPEYEHVFNLMLASQIQNYFLNKEHDSRFIDQAGHYTFYAPKKAGSILEFDAADSALLSYAIDRNLKQDLKNWAHEAQALRLTLRHIADFISRHFKLNDSSERKIPQAFAELALYVARKDGRPNMVERKRKLFSQVEQAAYDVYVQIAQRLDLREQQLGASIAWLKMLSNNCPELKIDDASIQDRPDILFNQYMAMSKDRNLEVASVRLFEEALDKKEHNLISQFEHKVDNGQHALDAIAVVIEESLRKEIRRSSAVPRQHDETVAHSETMGMTQITFIPMHVGNNSSIVNKYLQKIDLNALVDSGKNRQDEEVSIHDPNHPASLNQLSHFSIPSPWGAAILEQWNQKAAVEASKRNEFELLNRSAERLEAILWAIFTKKLVVKQIRAEHLGSIAHTAVRVRDIEIQQKCGDSSISVAINPHNQQLVAANYPTVGWFATPSIAGVLRDWWDEDELHFRLPTQLVHQLLIDSYDAKLIKSFTTWLQQMLDEHGEYGHQAASWYAVLNYIVQKLKIDSLNEVVPLALPDSDVSFLLQTPTQIQSFSVRHVSESVSEILNKVCCEQLIVLENEAVDGSYHYQYPNSPLKSHIKGQARCLNASGIMSDSQGKYMKLKYELILDEGKFEVERRAKIVFLRVQQVIWPNFKADDWQLYFAGGTATDNQSLINQISPEYAYRLYTQNSDHTKHPVKFLQTNQVEPQEFQTPLCFDRNYEIYGRPDVLVLLEKITGTDLYQEVGSIDVNLNEVDRNHKLQFKLGLDFGTSHSCVVALDRNERKITGIDFSRPDQQDNLLCKVIKTTDGDNVLLDEFRFIAPFASKAKVGDLDNNVVPTEFRFNQWLKPANPLVEIDAGIRYLTILPMQFNRPLAERSIKETGAIGDFKWGTPAKSSSLTNTVYENEEALLSVQYIKQILRIALAMLRAKGYTQLNTFRATYPEAFSTSHISIFARDLDQVWQQLLQETGIKSDTVIDNNALLHLKDFSQGMDPSFGQGLTEFSHGLISESLAALQTTLKTAERNMLADKHLQIVLDMGGGSTDVAAFVNPSSIDKTILKDIPNSLTDSIRYAGHDILSLLSTPEVVKVLDDKLNVDSSASQQQFMRVVKIAMRDMKAVERLQTRFVDAGFATKVKSNIRAFFDGLFEYTRQLISSYQEQLSKNGLEDITIGVVLLGNGWRLGNLVYTTTDLNNVDGLKYEMEQYIQKHLAKIASLDIIFPSHTDISVKESIAYGALLYNPDEEVMISTGETALSKKRYSFLGSTHMNIEMTQKFLTQHKLNERRGQQAVQIEQLPIFPKEADFVQRLDNIKGQEGKGLHFAKLDINKQMNIRWRSQEDEILISPMQLFLEHVWKPVLLDDK